MVLEEYRRKRDPAKTPEPVPDTEPQPAREPATAPVFVIQEHHARSLHWDLRLERDGVLVSWAVPKGLPNDPRTVRLAVHTEDHPMEYLTFSGEIPRGEYGGGRMSIWDRGSYQTLKWTETEVQVVLRGERVHGRFILLRRGRGPNDWLLRRGDGPARADWRPMPTGLCPMPEPPGELPYPDDGWCYEVRFGGSRVLVKVVGGRVELAGSAGEPVEGRHPELAGLGPSLGSTEVLLDAELDGTPPGLWISDLLYLDGTLVTELPYRRRRAMLEALPLTGPTWRLVPCYPGGGASVLAAAAEQRLPAVVAKPVDSPYRPEQSGWVRISTGARTPQSPVAQSPVAQSPVAQSPEPGRADPRLDPETTPPSGAGSARRTRAQAPVSISVAGRRVRLSNPDKVLYPATGLTKSGVLQHYLAVAEVMLPHLARRPVTLRRWPDGVAAPSFFEKNVSRHVPDWVATVRLETPGSSVGAQFLDYPLLDDEATLAWVANLAALELHVPQWRVDPEGRPGAPDLLVFDLDPGEGADIVHCARVAVRIAELLEEDNVVAYPRTSGGKGMQLYAPVQVSEPGHTSSYARAIAERLAAEDPSRVVAVMAKQRRRGKVFIDWSQNNPVKTTVASYSLRGGRLPTVATPLTWPEVREVEHSAQLRFTCDQLPQRLVEHGDLLAPLLGAGHQLPDPTSSG